MPDALNGSPDADLLDRYMAGGCTPAEQAKVRAWLAADTGRPMLVDALGRVGAQQLTSTAPADAGAAWSRFAQTKMVSERPSLRGMPRRERRWSGRWTLRWRTAYSATCVIAALAVTVLFVRGRAINHGTARLARTFTTVAGQQATIMLADGSRARLGPATTLRVHDRLADGGIDVRVVGQALFTVAPAQNRPFRVYTGNAITRVLGTEFLVRRYTTDRVAQVVVTAGRVQVDGIHSHTTSRHAVVLTSAMLGVVDDSGQVQVTPHVTVEEYTAWTMGKLVFHDTPARDAVLELGRAYGVDIRITDSTLAVQTLNCTVMLAQRSLAGVLEPLAAILDAHPVRAGRVITLIPGRAATRRPLGPSSSSASEPLYGR